MKSLLSFDGTVGSNHCQTLHSATFCFLWAVLWDLKNRNHVKRVTSRDSGKEFIGGSMNYMGVRWLPDVPHLIRVSSQLCHGNVPRHSLGKFHTFQNTYCPSPTSRIRDLYS